LVSFSQSPNALNATVIAVIQVALWQFNWLQLAKRGGTWRALSEWF
jgi:hypothetical protein